MQKKSRILILSTNYLPHIGGSELAIKNITDRIEDYEFDLITARLGDLPRYEKVGNINVFRVGGFFSLSNLLLPKNLLPLAIFFRARALLKVNEYKLIHAFQASGAAGAGWLIKVFYPNLTLGLTLQEGNDLDSQGFLTNFFRNLIIRKADFATAISKYLRNYLLKIKKNLEVEIIPNGVDIANFSQQFSYGELTALEDKLNIKADDKVIISVSRLVHKNGLDLLVKAMAELKNKMSEISHKLILVGDGPLRESLKFKVKSLKLEDSVIFTDSVSYEDLPIYLKISDVFVRPSRSEGLGTAFLEAMAAGVPVIATNVGGIPDFLEDRKTGLICSSEPEDIAFKIRVLFDNDNLRNDIIEKGRRLVVEKYDWNIIADKFKKLYIKYANLS